jgi:cytochrome c
MNKTIFLGSIALAMAGCSKAPSDEATATAANAAGFTLASAASGSVAPAAFAQCAACHVVKKGAPNGLGPNLYGVYGRKAGELASYTYSPAMKASGLVWDDATLDKYLASPRTVVSGTKMSFAGLGDPAKRAEIIAWLKEQK